MGFLLRRLNAMVDARPIAITRIMVGTAALVLAGEVFSILSRIVEGRAQVPLLLPLPMTQAAVTVWFALSVGAALMLIVGFMSRFAAASVATMSAVALLWEQQTYSSHHMLLLLLSSYLVLTRPGARWSFDARHRRQPDLVPQWPHVLMMSQVSVLYLFAGLSKIQSAFLSGDVLAAEARFDIPDQLFQALAVAAVPAELFLAAALWSRRLQPVAFMIGIGLHSTILIALVGAPYLLSFALLTLSTYPLFAEAPRGFLSSVGTARPRQRRPAPEGRRHVDGSAMARGGAVSH